MEKCLVKHFYGLTDEEWEFVINNKAIYYETDVTSESIDLNTDCESFVYIPVGPKEDGEETLQSCGVSKITFDFSEFYIEPNGEMGIKGLKWEASTIFFEHPRKHHSLGFITAGVAAMNSAKALDKAEIDVEKKFKGTQISE